MSTNGGGDANDTSGGVTNASWDTLFAGGVVTVLTVMLLLVFGLILFAEFQLHAIVLGGLTSGVSGAFAWGSSTIDWFTQTAPTGTTPVPFFEFAIPNWLLMVVGSTAAAFVVIDRLTAGLIDGGIPFIADVADLSRAGVVVFFAWLVYVRAESIMELVWWLAAAIPFILIGVVFYAFFQQNRQRARASTAARHTPDTTRDIIGDWGEITLNGLVAALAGVLAIVEVTTGSVALLGQSALAISSEFVYTAVVWLGYTSLGGDFGSHLLPSFTAEQFVFAAAILGGVALTLRRTGDDSGS